MQDFWNGVGVSNSTGPSAFAGQSAGYYTGGNLFMRTPSRNTTLATINLPSHRAGCGGTGFRRSTSSTSIPARRRKGLSAGYGRGLKPPAG
ncbi:MAG: conjugal transfer protein TraH [Sphingomonadales bacterium]